MTRTKPAYQRIASALQAMVNCKRAGNDEWVARHHETIEHIVREYFPSGSGVDSGTTFDFHASKPNRLVFLTAFHHMNDGGMYDGWTEHSVVVTADLVTEFYLKITGRDRNDIKDYLGEIFSEALGADLTDAQVYPDVVHRSLKGTHQ